MPCSGDSAPISTWYTPLNSRVFSIADDVLRLFDDADDARIAGVAAAERAGIGVGDVVADRAVGDALLHVAQRVDQPVGQLARRLQQVKGETLRAFGPMPGRRTEFLDEAGQRIWEEPSGIEN